MTTETLTKLCFGFFIALVVFICGEVFWLGARLAPELEDVRVRYEQIQPEMTEQQIDEIFRVYHTTKEELETARDSYDKPLSRPSSFTKIYDKPDGIEGDYFVRVYFDYVGSVVGKYLGLNER
jgi:hypothetical protein